MAFHENRHISFFILLAYIVLAFFAAKLFFSVVFPWTIPLIISVIMSAVIEKPVKHLEKRKIPRKIASAVCTLFYLTLFGTLCYFIVSVTVSQVKILALELPGLAESLMDKLEIILANLEKTLSGLPLHKLGIDISSLDSLLSGIKLPDFKASYIINPVFKAAVSLPTILISVVFVFVSTYFLTSERKTITAFMAKQLSPRVKEVLEELRTFMYSSVFGWIKAQLILICITSFELMVGFTLMKIPYAFLLAIIIAIIDALPILGVGTVLIPWAVICIFTGDVLTGALLCLMYAVVLIVRNSIEPKILSVQIGLHPFVTLLCIYFGYRLAGFGGMFLVPFTVILLCKLQELVVIKFFKE